MEDLLCTTLLVFVMLEKAIPCLKEVSGKIFKSKIAGHDISIVFPSIPENYDARKVDLKKGDLVVPKNVFGEKVKWGMVNAWPKGLFSVQHFYVMQAVKCLI